MANFKGQDRRFAEMWLLGRSSPAPSALGCDDPTSPGERFLLFVTVVLLPFEAHFGRVLPNTSIMFLIYVVLAGYVAINRLHCLDRIWMHPVFVAAYLFTGIIVALEYTSHLSSYQDILSFVMMIGGALFVAALCRDWAALKMVMYGYMGGAVWLGSLLLLTSYGTLSGVVATNYTEASLARVEAFRDSPITGNVNGMAFNCVQGGIVALAFALGSASVLSRNLFAAVGIYCLVVSSLPMSRGAIVTALISCVVLLKAYGIRQLKVWLLAGLLATSAVVLIPDAIWSRMTIMTEEGQKDSRVSLYETAIHHADDYWLIGVGAGNYFQKWGLENGFAHSHAGIYYVYGVHNVFLQLLINWGIFGLLAYLIVIWQAYRCLPKSGGIRSDWSAMSVLVIAVSVFLMLFVMHNFYHKYFSTALGILVAYQRWLLPRNGSPPVGG